jgi:hypothetical protein
LQQVKGKVNKVPVFQIFDEKSAQAPNEAEPALTMTN